MQYYIYKHFFHLFQYHIMCTCIHMSYTCFITKHVNHLFAGQKQLLGMWITKNGKNYYTIYICVTRYRKALAINIQ